MTREEAINKLVNARYTDEFQGDEELTTVHLMAIKELEQEPCEDAVSRRAAIEIARSNIHYGLDKEYEYSRELLEKTMAEISSLPSVRPQEPKTEWIPVSERLPEEMDNYMTTVDYGEYGLAVGQRYYYGKGLKWGKENCVIAWQPLPEPYKGSENKE